MATTPVRQNRFFAKQHERVMNTEERFGGALKIRRGGTHPGKLTPNAATCKVNSVLRQLIQPFDNAGDTLATTYAGRNHTVLFM